MDLPDLDDGAFANPAWRVVCNAMKGASIQLTHYDDLPGIIRMASDFATRDPWVPAEARAHLVELVRVATCLLESPPSSPPTD